MAMVGWSVRRGLLVAGIGLTLLSSVGQAQYAPPLPAPPLPPPPSAAPPLPAPPLPPSAAAPVRALTPVPTAPSVAPPPSTAQGAAPSPLPTAAAAGQPPAQPFLRIDPGFHTQVINRIATDAAQRIVATVSDDKTARLWSVEDGSPLAVLRVPIAEGEEGALYAVALSPDGRTALLAGYTGMAWDRQFSVYIYALDTQKMRGRLPGLPAPVNHLAFSPDGRSFALALGGQAGVRVIDAQNGRTLLQDADYQASATWVAYNREGQLGAVGLDGQVRLYDPASGTRRAKRALGGPGRPYSLAFSPDGRGLAVGYLDQARVEVLKADDLTTRTSLRGTESGGFGAVAWAEDDSILAAGSVRSKDGAMLLRRWMKAGTAVPVNQPLSRDTVSQIMPLAGGGVLAAAADPALVRLTAQGTIVYNRRSAALDFRDVGQRRLSLSTDGMVVDVQGAGQPTPVRIDLLARSITPQGAGTRALTPIASSAAPTATAAPRPVGPAPTVSDWRNTAKPRVAGKVVPLDPEETARSYAVAPSQALVVLGTDFNLRTIDRNGQPIAAFAVPAPVWGVTIAPTGDVVVAALGDGTLRWYGLSATGGLTHRAALFMASDGRRWAAWTEQGFFDHSEYGGKELVGYQLNRARNEAPDWFSFAQVYRLLYAPDLVAAAWQGNDTDSRRRAAELGDLRAKLDSNGPPTIELAALCWNEAAGERCQPLTEVGVTRALTPVAAQSPTPGAPPAGQGADIVLPPGQTNATLRYRLAERGGGVGPVDVFLNDRNVGRATAAVRENGGIRTQLLTLDKGLNRLQLRAYDARGAAYGQSRPVAVAATGAAKAEAISSAGMEEKPKLFLLAVGVNKYQPAINSLNFAVADARSIADAIRRRATGLYRAVDITELYDEAASRTAIIKALERIGAQAASNDTVLIYLSGHGVSIDNHYYYVSQNVPSADKVTSEALAEAQLVKAMAGIRARNGMLFLDTCYAGAFSIASASQLAHESGRYVLVAASSVEEALDSYDSRNGVFATAVLRALGGQGVPSGQTQVTNFDLGFISTKLVSELAKEKRHTQKASFKIVADEAEPFPIVELKR